MDYHVVKLSQKMWDVLTVLCEQIGMDQAEFVRAAVADKIRSGYPTGIQRDTQTQTQAESGGYPTGIQRVSNGIPSVEPESALSNERAVVTSLSSNQEKKEKEKTHTPHPTDAPKPQRQRSAPKNQKVSELARFLDCADRYDTLSTQTDWHPDADPYQAVLLYHVLKERITGLPIGAPQIGAWLKNIADPLAAVRREKLAWESVVRRYFETNADDEKSREAGFALQWFVNRLPHVMDTLKNGNGKSERPYTPEEEHRFWHSAE